LLFLSGLLIGCAAGPQTTNVLGDSQVRQLAPGLSVRYYDGFVRHIREIPEDEILLKVSRPGKPVTNIDRQFGGGEVFDSGKSRGVGMRMEGFLRMRPAGTYQFKALTNDGFSMHIGGAQVLYDPDVHGDRWTEPASYVAEEAGWYPVQLRYFQRKGTAALRLHWQPPGAEEFVPVPAEALGHIP
jgi:hypothetical protein